MYQHGEKSLQQASELIEMPFVGHDQVSSSFRLEECVNSVQV